MIKPRQQARPLELPPLIQTAEGITRRIGVEIEFARLSARRAAEALATEMGGSVVEEDNHAFVVQGTRLGDVTVELDLRHTHPQRCGTAMRPRLGRRSAAWLGSVVSHIVPCEMVTAPLPVTKLADVDPAIDVLRRAGATGRGTTLFASLGLHNFNVETPGLDAQTITAVLKAFALLEPWLRRNCVRNIQEWLTRFGERYPEVYVRRIVAPDYWPDLEGLADDYLAANPTRKRDLDLLPLLLFLDEARVRARLPHEGTVAKTAGTTGCGVTRDGLKPHPLWFLEFLQQRRPARGWRTPPWKKTARSSLERATASCIVGSVAQRLS